MSLFPDYNIVPDKFLRANYWRVGYPAPAEVLNAKIMVSASMSPVRDGSMIICVDARPDILQLMILLGCHHMVWQSIVATEGSQGRKTSQKCLKAAAEEPWI